MNNVRPGQWIMMISGAALLIFSFTDQWKDGDNLWKDFGVPALPALLAVLIALVVAIKAFGSGSMPDRVAGLSVDQWMVIFGLTAVLIFIGMWNSLNNISNLTEDVGGDALEISATFWLGFVASIGLLVGAVMEQKAGPNAPSTGSAPSPF
jgi:ABC-type arginine transport system permease subunit